MATAVVTGVTGQDGAYLTRRLLASGCRVFGTHRGGDRSSLWRLGELGVLADPKLTLVELDLTATDACVRLLERAEPARLFNLAGQSFVGLAFRQSVATAQINAIGPLHLLEAIRQVDPAIRFYQASTSELYGRTLTAPQNEETPFHPCNPYAAAKLFAHWSTVNYRESYGLFAATGILFNHESPLRGLDFVTRKIADAAAAHHLGATRILELGLLEARRDWGYADEYVDGMLRMLDYPTPETFVLATGRSATVREFTELAFAVAGTEVAWRGSGTEETGHCARTGRTLVRVDPALLRPSEARILVGDASRARDALGWQAKTDLETLCRMMVEADIRRKSAASRPAPAGLARATAVRRRS